MRLILAYVLVFLGCYGLGALVTAYYVTRWRIGRDIREIASGTAGARNAARALGHAWGIAVFLCDFAKGLVAVFLAETFLGSPGAVVAALGVTLGHVFPPQLGYRGGKGVATAAGAITVWAPLVLVPVIAGYALARMARLKAEAGAVAAFALAAISAPWLVQSSAAAMGLWALFALLVFTHRNGLRTARESVQ